MIRTLVTLALQELMRPLRNAAEFDPAPGYSRWDTRDGRVDERQTRRCPFCGGWFNTTAQQDAHERTCDQRPTDPTPAEVLALALPPHHGPGPAHPLSTDIAEIYEVDPRMVGHHRRSLLGRWSA